MRKILKIACLVLTVASIWFTFSFKGGKAYFKIGAWMHEIKAQSALTVKAHVLVAEASNEDDEDSEFA